MTSCTMRTRWLHSPLRTAGISTALFAAEHAIDVAEVTIVCYTSLESVTRGWQPAE